MIARIFGWSAAVQARRTWWFMRRSRARARTPVLNGIAVSDAGAGIGGGRHAVEPAEPAGHVRLVRETAGRGRLGQARAPGDQLPCEPQAPLSLVGCGGESRFAYEAPQELEAAHAVLARQFAQGDAGGRILLQARLGSPDGARQI